MKTYAPKGLHGAQLRALLAELQATPLQAAKFLQVTERTVWRWLKEENAPFAVLACLWHETPRGRECGALDVGNALVIERGLARSLQTVVEAKTGQLARLLSISDTGAANDALLVGPVASGGVERFQQGVYKPKGPSSAPSGAKFNQVVQTGAQGQSLDVGQFKP